MTRLVDLLADLNPPQREAVLHEGGPLLILAGAGSGKTRVLAYRVAHLIRERGVPPDRILAVTFTNKAAGEMRDRIARLVGGRIAERVWIGTFHRICGRLLRRWGERIGLSPRFVIYDEEDQRTAIREALRRLNLDERRISPGAVLGLISAAKNEGTDLPDYERRATTYFEQVVAAVWREYQRILAEHDALDFDDMLVETLRLFATCPDVLAECQERFVHILVDEYQDTNPVQFRLLSALAARHRNLCAVGDVDQAIYGWRGADIRNILEFERDFPDARVILMEQNYRSTKIILEAAEHLIRHNPHRYPKRLWTDNPSGEPLIVYAAWDEHDEARFVVEEVRALQAQGYPLRACAILYRINAQSRQFEEALLRAGIPYQVVGALRFYERREVKDLLAYLRLLVNSRDVLSLRRIANVPRRGIGEGTLARIEAAADRLGIPPLQAMRHPEVLTALSPQLRRAMEGFVAVLEDLQEAMVRCTVSELIALAIERTGYRAALEAEGTEEAGARLENLRELVTVAQEFERASGEASVEAFLEHVALMTDVDTYDEIQDRVTLLTLHAAKGLEFPVVFLCGLEEGLFPHSRSLEDPRELEEERRLAYVGITRAKERVYLTYVQQRTLFGRTTASVPSRFLLELPRTCLRELRSSRSEGGDWPPLVNREVPEFRVGEWVRHRHFGLGQVVEIEGEGSRAVVTVRFPGIGTKRLALGYAPLQKATD
ncbi:MAG: UvrD-helicase domain-containing protein [Armatimonadota bacterium]|nr:UvrD-helicase domain-containing protein [Armatimonadota bacterium]MDR7563848.1 UvrD-helicase domain-containing protein [Armatimonadota bacterium]MDR7567056.1 UvrD-helicase domain-containing protein [Armatimonadota bacterium]MDR7601521.1 UvrD-helicase domain-containing protein [Armatimonadota bacterium]